VEGAALLQTPHVQRLAARGSRCGLSASASLTPGGLAASGRTRDLSSGVDAGRRCRGKQLVEGRHAAGEAPGQVIAADWSMRRLRG
jgi:hypothetical protein